MDANGLTVDDIERAVHAMQNALVILQAKKLITVTRRPISEIISINFPLDKWSIDDGTLKPLVDLKGLVK